MKVNFDNKTVGSFDYEFLRCLSLQQSGAAELGECMDTMSRVKNSDFESWTVEWGKTAGRVLETAHRLEAQKDDLFAARAYLRACSYSRMACFFAAPDDPRHRSFWEQSRDCFEKYVQLASVPLEKVSISFEDARLPAFFLPSKGSNRPVLIALGGFDSTKEEVFGWIGQTAIEKDWNCLILEGPGQWGALMDNPGLVFRPDYEKPVGAAVDWLMERGGFDANKIALIGYSMGGYLSVRGAFDDRIKACIPNTLVVDCGASARAGMKGMVGSEKFMDRMFEFLIRYNAPARWGFLHSSWTLGIKNAHEWVQAYNDFTLLGQEDKLKGKPMLFLFSEDDIMDAAAPSKEIVAGILAYIQSLDCPKYVRLFTRTEGASSHCQMGGMVYAQSAIFRWLNHVLCGENLAGLDDNSMKEQFVSLFGKYGGEAGAKAADQLVPELTFLE